MEPNVLLSICLLLFGAIVTLVIGIVMIEKDHGWGGYSTRILICVVMGTLGVFIVTFTGFKEAVTPAFTLLGGFGGYLIARKE